MSVQHMHFGYRIVQCITTPDGKQITVVMGAKTMRTARLVQLSVQEVKGEGFELGGSFIERVQPT